VKERLIKTMFTFLGLVIIGLFVWGMVALCNVWPLPFQIIVGSMIILGLLVIVTWVLTGIFCFFFWLFTGRWVFPEWMK